jgi:hypothetical protein
MSQVDLLASMSIGFDQRWSLVVCVNMYLTQIHGLMSADAVHENRIPSWETVLCFPIGKTISEMICPAFHF